MRPQALLVLFVALLTGAVTYPLWLGPFLPSDSPPMGPVVVPAHLDPVVPIISQPVAPVLQDRTPDPVDTASTVADLQARVMDLEKENARLRLELRTAQLASQLVMLSPVDRPVTHAQVVGLLDGCYITENPELRMLFIEQVRPEVMLDLLREEPEFRAALARLRSDATPEFLQFEWPLKRDQLVSDFLRRLAGAGLSGRAIELYRVLLADYL